MQYQAERTAFRYWSYRLGKNYKPYDAIWFEGNASTIGHIYNSNCLSN